MEIFKQRYNDQWLVERHGHRTPAEVCTALVTTAGGRSGITIKQLPKKSGAVQ